MKKRTLSLKGLTTNNTTIAYVRAVPTALKKHPLFRGRSNYRTQLGSVTMTDQEVVEKWTQAHQDYTHIVEQLKNVNYDVIESNELIKKAESFLRVNNLKAGLLSSHNGYSEQANQKYHFALKHHLEQYGVFDDLMEYGKKENYYAQGQAIPYEQDMSAHVQVQEQAWKMLTKPVSDYQRQYLLSDCWPIYVAKKGIDESSRTGKRYQSCFNRFIKLVGDKVMSEDVVNDVLIEYVNHREALRDTNSKNGDKASPSPATIERELATILAALKAGIKKFRLRFHIEKPELRQDVDATVRYTFSSEELIQLVEEVTNPDSRDYQPFKELMMLIMVQSGMHITELLRLTLDRVRLDHAIPHIILSGKLKTKQRQRVIPLVYRVERIKELAALLDDGSQYFLGEVNAKRSADNCSTQLNNICKRINTDSTSYSCRHSFKHFATALGVDSQIIAQLGGWSGKELGLSNQMLGYGASGVLNEESLLRLQNAMITINQSLLEADKPSGGSEDQFKLLYLKK